MPDPDPSSEINSILNRPASERLREYKYRFAQSVVFGLPVIALQYLGPILGGPEAGRWVGMLQMLLAGWVMYVGAMGMLVEGMLLWKVTTDAIIAALAIGIYLICVVAVVHLFVTGRAWFQPNPFHWTVVIIMGWTATKWFAGSRASAS